MYVFTLNEYPGARPIARIQGGTYDGTVVYVMLETAITDNSLHKFRDFRGLSLTNGATLHLILPKVADQRYVVSAFGASGLGKTTMINRLLSAFYQENKKDINKIILFSKKNKEDEKSFSADLKKNMLQVDLDSDYLVTHPLDTKDESIKKEYKNSIAIFDDVNTLSDLNKRTKAIRNNVLSFRSDLLEVSRYLGTNVFITEHLATAGPLTKTILNESNLFILFISLGYGSYERFLTHYLNMKKKQIEKLFNDIAKHSRYIIFLKSIPFIYLTENALGFVREIPNG